MAVAVARLRSELGLRSDLLLLAASVFPAAGHGIFHVGVPAQQTERVGKQRQWMTKQRAGRQAMPTNTSTELKAAQRTTAGATQRKCPRACPPNSLAPNVAEEHGGQVALAKGGQHHHHHLAFVLGPLRNPAGQARQAGSALSVWLYHSCAQIRGLISLAGLKLTHPSHSAANPSAASSLDGRPDCRAAADSAQQAFLLRSTHTQRVQAAPARVQRVEEGLPPTDAAQRRAAAQPARTACHAAQEPSNRCLACTLQRAALRLLR